MGCVMDTWLNFGFCVNRSLSRGLQVLLLPVEHSVSVNINDMAEDTSKGGFPVMTSGTTRGELASTRKLAEQFPVIV